MESGAVGIPDHLMNTLWIPETVDASNIAELTEAVRRGPGVPGGAARVLHVTNVVTELGANAEPPVLQVGDVVERHLRDGDKMLLSRQPTLHGPFVSRPIRRHSPPFAFARPADIPAWTTDPRDLSCCEDGCMWPSEKVIMSALKEGLRR